MTLEVRPDADLEQPSATRSERVRQHLVATRVTAVAVTRRQAWSAWRVARQLPGAMCLLVRWSPRGAWRLLVAWGAYLRDEVTDELRSHHARERQSADYDRVSKQRALNLRARLRVNAAAVALGLVLVGAWWAPSALAVFVGVGVGAAVIRVLPWRQWAHELALAAAAGWGAWAVTPWAASFVPRPPAWALWVAGAGAVLGCGWAGRPKARPLVTRSASGERMPPTLTAPMVMDALCALGIAGLKDPDSIRQLTDVHRYGPGVQVEVELPGAVTAAQVVQKRSPLAAALKRELGCVWPSAGPRNESHLIVFVGLQPMVRTPQKPWPLLESARVDLFRAQEQFTNQRGEWVKVTLAYAAVVIGAQPRMGKTFILRQFLLAAGLDPRTKVYALDGKGTGDLAPTSLFADFYSVGDEPEEVERVLSALRELRAEMRRRARFIRSLSHAECPESKVTSELADRYPDLGLIVIGIDETQSYFGYGGKRNKEDRDVREEITDIITDLAKRGPALGFVPILATQNVCEETIPRQISLNAVIRACLKVFDHNANDQVLGTGAYSRGVDATAFDIEDKGLMWLRADGGQPQIVRSVAGLDVPAAEKIARRARALRIAAGTMRADDDVVAVEIVDLSADVRQVMTARSRHTAHYGELVDWLRELRPESYRALSVEDLPARLRADGMTTGNVWANSKSDKGVDLRKQDQRRSA